MKKFYISIYLRIMRDRVKYNLFPQLKILLANNVFKNVLVKIGYHIYGKQQKWER